MSSILDSGTAKGNSPASDTLPLRPLGWCGLRTTSKVLPLCLPCNRCGVIIIILAITQFRVTKYFSHTLSFLVHRALLLSNVISFLQAYFHTSTRMMILGCDHGIGPLKICRSKISKLRINNIIKFPWGQYWSQRPRLGLNRVLFLLHCHLSHTQGLSLDVASILNQSDLSRSQTGPLRICEPDS